MLVIGADDFDWLVSKFILSMKNFYTTLPLKMSCEHRKFLTRSCHSLTFLVIQKVAGLEAV